MIICKELMVLLIKFVKLENYNCLLKSITNIDETPIYLNQVKKSTIDFIKFLKIEISTHGQKKCKISLLLDKNFRNLLSKEKSIFSWKKSLIILRSKQSYGCKFSHGIMNQ